MLDESNPKGLKDWYVRYALPDLVRRGEIEDETKKPTFKFGSLFESIPFDSIPEHVATYYACHDVFMTMKVFEFQKRIFEEPSFKLDRVYNIFREIEMPLIPILTTAERRGIGLDGEFLENTVGKALKEKLHDIVHGYMKDGGERVEGIYDYLGSTITLKKTKTRTKNKVKYKEEYTVVEPFNLGSPAQVAQKLYHEYGILVPEEKYDKKLRKKVPKYSTDKKTLIRNQGKHKVIDLILEYRGLAKLIEAFADKLPKQVIDGKVHCSYNQLVRTGRMSCKDPNLQQIPSGMVLMRYAFQALEGRLLASIDFSQQELRWLAIFTKDETLLDIFKKGLDMHSSVTCNVYGLNYEMFEQIRNYEGKSSSETSANLSATIEKWAGTADLDKAITLHNERMANPLEKVNEETIKVLAEFFDSLRSKIKPVVFGSVYGITPAGLSVQIRGTEKEAEELLNSFKESLPGYLQWEKEVHKEVEEKMYVETVLGRKRRFMQVIEEAKKTDLYRWKGWHWKIDGCKRQGSNFEIQGSSADQTKKAAVNLFYPKRPDGTLCFDRREWVREGYQSSLEKSDSYILLFVHDEIIFDIPDDIPYEYLEEFAETMQNAIPNDVGVKFKSDIEVSPYWGGKLTQEQLKALSDGELDWKQLFWKDVQDKLKKFGMDYEVGTFMEVDEEY